MCVKITSITKNDLTILTNFEKAIIEELGFGIISKAKFGLPGYYFSHIMIIVLRGRFTQTGIDGRNVHSSTQNGTTKFE